MRVVKGIILIFFISISVFAEENSIKRDPFFPIISKSGQILIYQEKEGVPLKLKGIIYSPPKSCAIISDEIVKEGDQILGYKVISIEEKRVILKKDKEDIILKMEEE